jgi:apolipoprotein N-acyltransferase
MLTIRKTFPLARSFQVKEAIVVRHRGSPGVLVGVLACVFGVLGILTFGFIFVPLAAVCSLIGLLRGVAGMSPAGIGTSLLGGVLTIVGFAVSPSLWLLFAVATSTH